MNAAVDIDEREASPGTDVTVLQAISKAELDQQITTARAFPRSLKRFVTECMDMATLNEQVAGECIYALPRDGKTIEGPSARLAEIVASAWGNARCGARVVDEGPEFITAQGVFHDLERNVMITMEVRRRITGRDGKRYKADMIGVTGNAACSIALRNAVFKWVPKAFWSGIYDAARKAAVGDIKTIATKRADALAYLQKHGVTVDMVLATLGLAGEEDIGLDEMATLKGMITAIREGDTTIEQAFAPRETAAPQRKPPTSTPKTKAASKKAAGETGAAAKGHAAAPTPAAAAEPAMSAPLVERLRDKCSAEGIPENAVCAKFEVGDLSELKESQYQTAFDWIATVNA